MPVDSLNTTRADSLNPDTTIEVLFAVSAVILGYTLFKHGRIFCWSAFVVTFFAISAYGFYLVKTTRPRSLIDVVEFLNIR